MKRLLKPMVALLWLCACNAPEPRAGSQAQAITPLQKDSGAVLQQRANPYAAIDLSPMDIAYFPVDYPIAKMTNPSIGLPLARVIYSRPHMQHRKIFGSLLKYGQHWRLGANEATEIELFRDALVQGKKIARGRYILYAVPQAASWTIIFNSNTYSWGLKQDAAQDKYRFEVPVEKTAAPVEFYTMVFEKTSSGANLILAWDAVVARLPFIFP